MSPEIQSKKLDIIQWVAGIQDESLLDELQKIMQSENRDWWDEISQEEKAAIEAGLADEKAGNFISHKEARKTWGKWLTK
jgi:predicted transcriptional regulator